MTWDQRHGDALGWLLHPYSIKHFKENYYERAPLLIQRSSPSYYESIFSLKAVDEILYGDSLAPHDLRIAKSGQEVMLNSYVRMVQRIDPHTKKMNWIQLIDPYRVGSLFSHGCTLELEDLRGHCASIAKLLSRLERFFCHDMFAASFLTPPNSQGFDLHFDTGDNLILQIDGRKRWRIYQPAIELPLEQFQGHDRKKHQAGALLLDIQLEPGDMLYMPRGTFHEAEANADEHSLHVSINLLPVRWHAVLGQILTKAATEHVMLRRSTASALDHEKLVEVLLEAISPLNLHRTALELESRFAEGHRHPLDGHITQILGINSLTMDSLVSIREGALYRLTTASASSILECAGTKITLPKDASAVIGELESGGPVSVRKLLERSEDALLIVRRLITSGLLLQGPELQPNAAPDLKRTTAKTT